MRRALQIIFGLAISVLGIALTLLALSGVAHLLDKTMLLAAEKIQFIFGDLAEIARGIQELAESQIITPENVMEGFVNPIYYISALLLIGHIFILEGLNLYSGLR